MSRYDEWLVGQSHCDNRSFRLDLASSSLLCALTRACQVCTLLLTYQNRTLCEHLSTPSDSIKRPRKFRSAWKLPAIGKSMIRFHSSLRSLSSSHVAWTSSFCEINCVRWPFQSGESTYHVMCAVLSCVVLLSILCIAFLLSDSVSCLTPFL